MAPRDMPAEEPAAQPPEPATAAKVLRGNRIRLHGGRLVVEDDESIAFTTVHLEPGDVDRMARRGARNVSGALAEGRLTEVRTAAAAIGMSVEELAAMAAHFQDQAEQLVNTRGEPLREQAASVEPASAAAELEQPGAPTETTPRADNAPMADVTREEMTAAIKASEMTTRADWADFRLDMKKGLADLSVEMHRGFADMIKWMVGIVFTAAALAVAVASYMGKNAPTAPPPAAQPPVIINIPPTPAAVPATPAPAAAAAPSPRKP